MKEPFSRLTTHPDHAVAKWASQSFAGGSTFRLFERNSSKKIRKYLRTRVAHCRQLARARNECDFSETHAQLVKGLQRRVKLNSRLKHRPPNFGQAAKVINLYVKQFLLGCDFLRPYPKKELYRFAHVPLDGIVLKQVWEDFGAQLSCLGLSRRPSLNRLDRSTYAIIQNLLAKEAHKQGLPPLAYDFAWSADR